MTEKEKKAIEFINDLISWDIRQDLCPNKKECEKLEIILNLIEKQQCELEINEANLLGYSRQIEKDDLKIEKQQREIERLKRDNKKLDIENQKLFEDTIENYIHKEAIKEKIKEVEESHTELPVQFMKLAQIQILNELLGE